jgi:pyruvate,orthophosphate dikinase
LAINGKIVLAACLRFTLRIALQNKITLCLKNHPLSAKYVYLFGNKQTDGDGSMNPLLGGKGANLAEMTRIGLPVPPGFTITTEVCTYYYQNKKSYPKELAAR